MIRTIHHDDVAQITDIYNYYIKNSTATQEEELINAADMQARVDNIIGLDLPWLVAAEAGKIIGYAYASKWHARSAYRNSTEVTVYILHQCLSKGWGTKLYEHLFNELRQKNKHAIIATIGLPNEASVALHEKFGMRKVSHFNEIGFKFGRWLDVGHWQVLL